MPLRLSTYKRHFLSLKGRLLLGLIATWGVVLALLLGGGWQSGKALLEEVTHTHLRYEAQLIADDLSDQVNARLSALERLAWRVDALRRPGDPRLEDGLRLNDVLLEWFDGLFVTDASGTILSSWPLGQRLEDKEIGQYSFFSQVRAFKRPVVSDPVRLGDGEAEVLFLVPRLGMYGRFDGVIGGVVKLDSEQLFGQLDRLRLGEAGYASVMSASGALLYHPRRDVEPGAVPDAEASHWQNLAQLGWEGEAREASSDGTKAYRAYRQIWPANWVVGISLPQNQVMVPLEGWLRHLGWRFALAAVLLLPVIGWLLWLALRPLLRLESQIEEVGRGRRSQVTLNTRMHELQQVADTFNRVEVERGQALASLEGRQAFLDAILASSPVGMFVTDIDGTITYMNQALVELTGFSLAMDARREWMRHVHPDDHTTALELWHRSMAGGEDFLQQFRYYRQGGELLWLEVHTSPVIAEERVLGFVGTVKDITERREEEALRQWEAEHDPLTGLLNRRGFERRLEEALADWRKTGTPSSLILFDLDHFKPINDEGGHALGDEMLRRIAQVVAWEVRRSDHVARQGGDEFAVLLPSCTPAHAEKVAQSLIEAVGEVEVTQEGSEFRVTLSLGLTSFQEGDERIATVIERADDATYRAKRGGRNRAVTCEASVEDVDDILFSR